MNSAAMRPAADMAMKVSSGIFERRALSASAAKAAR